MGVLQDRVLESQILAICEELASKGILLSTDAVLPTLLERNSQLVRRPQSTLRKSVGSVVAIARLRFPVNPNPDSAKIEDSSIAPPSRPSNAMVDVSMSDSTTESSIPVMTVASMNSSLYRAPTNEQNEHDSGDGENVGNSEEVTPSVPHKRRRHESTKEMLLKAALRKARSDLEGKSEKEGETDSFTLPPFIRPSLRFSDVGGLDETLRTVRELIEYPLLHPEVYLHLGVEPPRGILLHGPPGVGKTHLANAIGGELGVHFRSVAAPELVGGVSGESENRLRTIFDDAIANAPAVLFIDEVDAIAPRRESTARGMERRMVAQLIACMDGLTLEKTMGKPVIVLAATSKPENIDSSLRRTGRFDREVSIPIPDEKARLQILKVIVKGMRLLSKENDPVADPKDYVNLAHIAKETPGYVGADLCAVAREAAAVAIDRVLGSPGVQNPGNTNSNSNSTNSEGDWNSPFPSERLEPLYVIQADLEHAKGRVQPSAMREGFATVPNTTWQDVGALSAVRSELEMSIVQPLRRPDVFAALGLAAPAGVLLYGPPGCGKTLLAKAVANETAANFISVKGPELLDKYVGESERAVRGLFARARASAPCVVFFDELDALAPRRGGGGSDSGGGVSERVVNQLLTELDGLETRKDVFVIAATNRPDIIDPAMLRPGRLDKLLFVPLPTPLERAQILHTHTKRLPIASDVNIADIATDKRCERFSGADLAALAREASVAALKEFFVSEGVLDSNGLANDNANDQFTSTPLICMKHFDMAFSKCQPSVSAADEKAYNALRLKLRKSNIEADDSSSKSIKTN